MRGPWAHPLLDLDRMANKEKARKKAGQDTNKKRRRMRAAVAERHRTAAPEEPARDEVDVIKYKPGSASDRTVSEQQRQPSTPKS